jgi:hypothetical protein
VIHGLTPTGNSSGARLSYANAVAADSRNPDGELRRLAREVFAQGISGEKLAEAAGLSVPRVYQIQDGPR